MVTPNDRIFYACQGVSVQLCGSKDLDVQSTDMVHGLQSVGVNTTFNLEQVFELGQIEIYENIEGLPDIQVTMEKVLDGYPLIYHLATRLPAGTSTAGSGLVGRSKQRCDVRLGIFPEEYANIDAGGAAASQEIYMSGMYVSNISYTLPVDGNSTESCTLVGNNKQWFKEGTGRMKNASVANFDGEDSPLSLGIANSPSGGVQRREDVMLSGSILPLSIQGITSLGYANALNGTVPKVHIQSVAISTDFGREDILELGRKAPYARPATFPIEVTCEIEVVTTSGDFVNALENGDPDLWCTTASGNNTQEEPIFICTRSGYGWDLGSKNRLSSVNYGGGDAGGGNATVTYSYSNYNDLDVQSLDAIGGGLANFGHNGKKTTKPYGNFPGGIFGVSC